MTYEQIARAWLAGRVASTGRASTDGVTLFDNGSAFATRDPETGRVYVRNANGRAGARFRNSVRRAIFAAKLDSPVPADVPHPIYVTVRGEAADRYLVTPALLLAAGRERVAFRQACGLEAAR